MNTAKRMAFSRRADKKVKQLPMLIPEDFHKAIERNRIRFSNGRR
jgi:hypothetical protein